MTRRSMKALKTAIGGGQGLWSELRRLQAPDGYLGPSHTIEHWLLVLSESPFASNNEQEEEK